jgi:small subunit ribosomal protein S1
LTRVESYGAFVELLPGIEGLVHVSELGGEARVQHASDVVTPGQEVRVRVLDVDPVKRRISLSIGAAAAAAAAREQSAQLADFAQRSQAGRGGFGSMAEGLARALGSSSAEEDDSSKAE